MIETGNADRPNDPERQLAWIQVRYILLVGLFVAGAVFARTQLGWDWIGPVVILAAFALSFSFVRRSQNRAKALGYDSGAYRRANRRLLFFSGLYMVSMLGAAWAYRRGGVEGPWLWPLALLPAVFVIGMIVSMARQILEEQDEYLRSRLVAQALIATACMLVVTTVWGFLEQFKLVPHVPLWATLPLVAIFMPVAQFYRPKLK